MIAEGMLELLAIFFNCVHRDDEALLLMHEKSARNRHAIKSVIFKNGAFLKEECDGVSEWSRGIIDWAARFSKCVEAEQLRPALLLPAGLEDRDRHLYRLVPLDRFYQRILNLLEKEAKKKRVPDTGGIFLN